MLTMPCSSGSSCCLAIAFILVGLSALALCTADVPEINTNHRLFADDLTSAMSLYASESNQCISPLGVSMALSLVYPGASGLSAQQMQSVLGYPEDEPKLSLLWEDTSNRLVAANNGECTSGPTDNCYASLPKIDIANSAWLHLEDELVPAYEDVVGEYAKQIDFLSRDAGGVVNEWVDDNTNGLIDSIVPEGRIDALMLAINAIYLKASWDQPFSEYETNEDTFYTSPTRSIESTSKAHFMHTARSDIWYSHTALNGYQILRLPFNGDSLSMVFVLPEIDGTGFATSSQVVGAMPDLMQQRVAVALPKFNFESRYERQLELALKSLGMTAPWAGGLCGLMVGSCGFIEKIIQKTAIDVNEKGVEAAAATLVVVGKTGTSQLVEPVVFMANHPFQFLIYDEQEDIVLFEGLVVEPGIPEGSNAPLKALHSDQSFWEGRFNVVNPRMSPSQIPRTAEKPRVVESTSSSAVIKVHTSIPAQVRVVYSKKRRMMRRGRRRSQLVTTEYDGGDYTASIELTGLTSNTRYFYKIFIVNGIQDRRKRRFRTRRE